ncbi:MAG: 4Fe-4S binding protein [Bacteroidales bacterium]|nr:4Fe-4S binding protein [Bacteroidales bacterium]
MAYKITNKCKACGECIDACPVGAISKGSIYSIDADSCVGCGTCASVCRNDAIVEA